MKRILLALRLALLVAALLAPSIWLAHVMTGPAYHDPCEGMPPLLGNDC